MGLSQTLLQKIADARTTAGGDWIRDGRYKFQVKRVLLEDKYKGPSFIGELVVVAAAPVNPNVAPNAVGTCPSFVYNIEKHESAAGNAKAFLLALLGLPADTKPEKFVEEMVRVTGTDQPARGMLVRGETYRKPIQRGANAGKDYVGVNWEHVKQTPEEVAAARAALDDGRLPPVTVLAASTATAPAPAASTTTAPAAAASTTAPAASTTTAPAAASTTTAPAPAASTTTAPAPAAILIDDLEMDGVYRVGGPTTAPLTFLGTAKGVARFRDASGVRHEFGAAALAGQVFAAAPSAAAIPVDDLEMDAVYRVGDRAPLTFLGAARGVARFRDASGTRHEFSAAVLAGQVFAA